MDEGNISRSLERWGVENAAVSLWRHGVRLRCCWAAVGLVCTLSPCLAEPVDTSRLPPPTAATIDFQRDIKPILQSECLKCHSDERPRSGFRLTSREAALKGGEHGIDILPGRSADSPLIHYVARLVPDLEMPPEGRGTPLSPEQVGLLRAWIDQGVVWENVTNEPSASATVTPVVGWTKVHGDLNKFRELYWQREGWNGGLDEFEIVSHPGPDTRVSTAGHLLRDDYRITLELQKNDVGFGRFGWTQFRKYYDDNGGYYPLFTPSSFSLDRDLHFDDGRAYVEFGLTLPHWPELTIGYEHQYRNGSEATLQWGPVISGTEARNIYPAFKDISERVEILKFDLAYTVTGVSLSDSFRGEWYKLDTDEVNESGFTLGTPGMAFTTAKEQQGYFQGANTLHLEKQFTDWLFASGGYLYSKLTSDGSLSVDTLNPAFLYQAPFLSVGAPAGPGWQADSIQLERESHVFSLSTMLGPWEGVTLSLATQNEWTHQTGLAGARVSFAIPVAPFIFQLQPPEDLHSEWDRAAFSQDVGLRFTKIPFTTLFADIRLQQDDVGQSQQELNGLTPFLRNTDASSDLKDFRVGFNTSPWRRVSWSARYRWFDHNTYYNNRFKEPSDDGYPAFISQRGLLSTEAETKLAVQWAPWLKTTAGYQWLANDYRTITDPANDRLTGQPVSQGGGLLAGTYKAHNPSLNAIFMPGRRWFLSATFAYQRAQTITAANGSPSVAPYEGDIYSVMFSGSFALNDRTDLVAGYAFSTADFHQNNLAEGLPLGAQYQQHSLKAGLRRKIGTGKTLGLQYRFFLYDEPSSGGVANFDAHAIFATFACRF